MSAGEMLLQPTNMLRAVATILLFFVYSSVFAQSAKLKEVSQSLGAALLKKDTVVINKLLH